MSIKRFYLILLVFLEALVSCKENDNPKFSLIREHRSLYFVQIKTDSSFNQWKLPYPTFQFKTGDIDGDGSKDILVGVIKKTRFDSTLNKRLFIFKNYKGLVRPLWLGSRLGHPLIDFNYLVVDNEPRIRSMEKEKSGNYLIAEYRWRKFGLEFIHYKKRELTYKNALHLLQD
jgi:ribosomal protein L21E